VSIKQEYVNIVERGQQELVGDKPTITLQININNADFKSVQQFIWDLNAFATLRNFDFDANTARSNPRKRIGVNKIDANLIIVESTIRFLQGETDTNEDTIGEFLFTFFPAHLKILYNDALDKLSDDKKKMIGRAIYDLFDDMQITQKHWTIFPYTPFYRNKERMEIFLQWLDEPAALEGLSRKDKEWLGEARATRNPERALFVRTMQTFARLWLRGRETGVYKLFHWLCHYLEVSKTVNGADFALVAFRLTRVYKAGREETRRRRGEGTDHA
jgi:hypothetical protein